MQELVQEGNLRKAVGGERMQRLDWSMSLQHKQAVALVSRCPYGISSSCHVTASV